MKKIGIIILSRYNSNRLPGKALIEINGITLLGNIVKNVEENFPHIDCIVATSNHKSDDKIQRYCEMNFSKCYRGSLDNVAKRFLDCSVSLNLDYAIRINGDNFFLDINLLKDMIKKINTGEYDFISNVPGRTFPFGMSIEIVKTNFYKRVYKKINTIYDKEHVTSWLYNNQNYGSRYYYTNEKYKNLKDLKVSIDEQSDLDFVKKIIAFNNNKNNISLESLSKLKDKILSHHN